MIHPSYVDLMKVVNKDVEEGETPVINSRYSIVMATAKRARQIVDGDEPLVKVTRGEKPLSIAVDELNQAEIRILAEDEVEEEYTEFLTSAPEEAFDEDESADVLSGDDSAAADAQEQEETADGIAESAEMSSVQLAADPEIEAADEAEEPAEDAAFVESTEEGGTEEAAEDEAAADESEEVAE